MVSHYTVQEAAEMTQVNPHTLRFYERIGLLRVSRADNGHRRYTDDDLGWVRFVMLLRGTKMPLPEIAAFMKLEKDGQTTIDKRRQMLENHRETLVQHIHELQTYLTALDAKIDYYRQTDVKICDCVRPDAQEQEQANREAEREGEIITNGISSTGTNGYQSEYAVSGVDELRQQHG